MWVLPPDSPDLHHAETISILFCDQKIRVKGVFRMAWATSVPTSCPIVSFAHIVRQVSSLPSATDDTLIYNHYKAISNHSFLAVTNTTMTLSLLRVATSLIGKEVLGYQVADVGTQSIHLGAAMTLILLGQHTAWRIMLAGCCWQSQAFLIYIRKDIQQFSRGISERMISNPNFYHVPNINTLEPGMSN